MNFLKLQKSKSEKPDDMKLTMNGVNEVSNCECWLPS